jgi:hypothetical protein
LNQVALAAEAEPFQQPLTRLVGRVYRGHARAQEIDGEFTVLAGSQARAKWAGGELKRSSHGRQELRESFVTKGVLALQDEWMVFTQNQVFSSPSPRRRSDVSRI